MMETVVVSERKYHSIGGKESAVFKVVYFFICLFIYLFGTLVSTFLISRQFVNALILFGSAPFRSVPVHSVEYTYIKTMFTLVE